MRSQRETRPAGDGTGSEDHVVGGSVSIVVEPSLDGDAAALEAFRGCYGMSDALTLAGDLLAHGVPVVVCKPNTAWRPGAKAADVIPRAGWNVITAAECSLDDFRPGVDTLAMVSGHGVDVVDVDPKAGGTVDHLPPFRAFGVHRTPSGGRHYLVRSTGLGKLSPLSTPAGHVGDYAGGTGDGGGRMLVYLPGSTRPKYPGKAYTIERRVDLAELLEHDADDDLVNALEQYGGKRIGLPGKRAASYTQARQFQRAHAEVPADQCAYGRKVVADILATATGLVPGDPALGRHAWAVRATTRVVELVRAGCATAADLAAVEDTLERIKPEGGTDFLGVLAWAMTNATGTTGCHRHRPTVLEVRSGGPDRGPLDRLLTHLRTWQDGTDLGHVVFALAVAVSAAETTGDPLWGMIVGPPSSGKTEAVRTLDETADDRVDELTAAALLSWSRAKQPKATGVLTRVPNPALLTVGDFSTVLATSDHGGRDQLFSLLRRVYDGAVTRDLGNAPSALRWEGHLTILAAVTPAIDDYSSHADALGPRWLYLRMDEVPRAARRRAAGRRTTDLAGKRATARAAARNVVLTARGHLRNVSLTDDMLTALGDAAIVVAAARGAVPRDGYGRREVIGMPVVEEPHRLVGQLQLLTRSLLALGLDDVEALHLAIRAALDTVPRTRLAVLHALANGEVHTVSTLAEAAGLNRKVARFAVEDLREVELTCCPVEDKADVDDLAHLGTVRRDWQLTADLGDLAAAVLAEQADRGRSLGTKKGGPPPVPPYTDSQRSDQERGYGVATPLSYQATHDADAQQVDGRFGASA